MGCHTWCYAHIPEKANEWNQEYFDSILKSATKMLNSWKTMDEKRLQEYVDDDNANNDSLLSTYFEYEADGKRDELINDYFNGEADSYEAYKDSLKHHITADELRQNMIDYENRTIDTINKYSPNRVIDFICDNVDNTEINTTDIFGFGLFIVRNGKIYRNTCNNNEGHYIFDRQFHDIFRIYDYEAASCYSYMETIERCGQYDVEMTEQTFNRIKDFWDTYPDGIIEFG